MTNNIDAARTIAQALEALGWAIMASAGMIATAICAASDQLITTGAFGVAAGISIALFTMTSRSIVEASDRCTAGPESSLAAARDSK